MDFLPIFINIRNRPCVVIGGGEVASRKVSLLQRAGGDVTVISPVLCTTLKRQLDNKTIQFTEASFDASQLDNAALIIACTDDSGVNEAVHKAAVSRNIPVNVVDNPQLCTFIMPSIIDRSPIVAAVSSGGVSPVLARIVRTRLETLIPEAYGKLGQLAADYRDKVKAKFSIVNDRRVFWENVLQGPIAEMVFSGQDRKARHAINEELQNAGSMKTGEVYLVGGGPGDPDLLTFRALRLMQQADVIVHDRLVSQGVLDLCRRDAEMIYVGKERDRHTLQQEGINELLVRLAREGKRVCRLKGGDPFIFGRGGEEIDTLVDEGVPFQVVPGITAASGVASYAGIPLTHRDYSQSVVFVTAHLKDGTTNLNWPGLVQPNQTLVFYMGLVGVGAICKGLIDHGMSRDMPMSLVQRATTRDQKVLIGTLDNMPELVKKSDIKPPTLIIVGEVVSLHDKLNWFEPERVEH